MVQLMFLNKKNWRFHKKNCVSIFIIVIIIMAVDYRDCG